MATLEAKKPQKSAFSAGQEFAGTGGLQGGKARAKVLIRANGRKIAKNAAEAWRRSK